MTNITIPKKVVEQALEALCDTETPDYRPQYGVESLAIYDLKCALAQCEAEDPAKQKPAIAVPAFNHVAQRKLDGLLADGWAISGYSICKLLPSSEMRHGFVTTGGMVGWWQQRPTAEQSSAVEQPQGEQEPVAEVHLILPQYHDAKQAPTKTVHLVRDVPAGTKLYTHSHLASH